MAALKSNYLVDGTTLNTTTIVTAYTFDPLLPQPNLSPPSMQEAGNSRIATRAPKHTIGMLHEEVLQVHITCISFVIASVNFG